MTGSSTQFLSTSFFGRATELDALAQGVRDPAPRAVLVVGQPGMGKSQLVQKFGEMMAAGLPGVRGAVVAYEVTSHQSAQSVMASMVRDAYNAAQAERRFFSGDERKWKALLSALGTIPMVGSQLKSLAELLASWAPDEKKDARDELIARLTAISEHTSEDTRLVFVIDAVRELSPASDAEWALVVRKLPAKVKFIFAQRPNDVIATSPEFRELQADGRARRIPDGELGVLDAASLRALVESYAPEVGVSASDLAACVDRFDAHPYAVHAALNLIAAAGSEKRDAEMARVRSLADPTPMGIAREQFRRAGEIGPTAAKLLEAYAILEAPAPDELACVVAEIDATEHRRLMADRYFSTLLREEAGDERGRRLAIYHAILGNYVRGPIGDVKGPHSRATGWFTRQLEMARTNPRATDTYLAMRGMFHGVCALDGLELAQLLNDLVFGVLMRLGEFSSARDAILCAFSATSDGSVAPILFGALGTIDLRQGKLTAAKARFEEALAIEEQLGRRPGVLNQLVNLGLVEMTLGELNAAEKHLDRAIDLGCETGNNKAIAAALGNLGLIAQSRQQWDKASQYHRRSLAACEEIGDRESMAVQCGNLGTCARVRGDLVESKEFHSRALRMLQEFGMLIGVADQYCGLGLVAMEENDLSAASDYMLKSLEVSQRIGNQEGVANVLGNLGLIEKRRENLSAAWDYFQAALNIDEGIGRAEGTAIALLNLGEIANRQGDAGAALKYWTRALEISVHLGASNRVSLLQKLIRSVSAGGQ